jgi:hypothetical protein
MSKHFHPTCRVCTDVRKALESKVESMKDENKRRAIECGKALTERERYREALEKIATWIPTMHPMLDEIITKALKPTASRTSNPEE